MNIVKENNQLVINNEVYLPPHQMARFTHYVKIKKDFSFKKKPELSYTLSWASQVSQWQGICLSMQDTGSSWVWKVSWKRKWQPTPVFLLGNPMDRGAWHATVHGVAKSWT